MRFDLMESLLNFACLQWEGPGSLLELISQTKAPFSQFTFSCLSFLDIDLRFFITGITSYPNNSSESLFTKIPILSLSISNHHIKLVIIPHGGYIWLHLGVVLRSIQHSPMPCIDLNKVNIERCNVHVYYIHQVSYMIRVLSKVHRLWIWKFLRINRVKKI